MAAFFSRLPSIPYPPEQDGWFSPVTSTLDWCEEVRLQHHCIARASADFLKNYVVTQYAAEIINTLTNLLFMYLAAKGIRNCLKNGHDTVFLVAFIGYLLVGTGSFLFHATLKCMLSVVSILDVQYLMHHRSHATCR
jgi:dihydroceramidase